MGGLLESCVNVDAYPFEVVGDQYLVKIGPRSCRMAPNKEARTTI